MQNNYSEVINTYFKRLLPFAFKLLIFMCAFVYTIIAWIPILSLLLLIALPIWIWIEQYVCDVMLIPFYFKIRKELRSSNPQTKIIIVHKIKPDPLYNVEGLNVRTEGLERYVLYDAKNFQYRLCAKAEMAALDDLDALNGAVLKIDYLLQSGFILSLSLLKKKDEIPVERLARKGFSNELQMSFEQYSYTKYSNKFDPQGAPADYKNNDKNSYKSRSLIHSKYSKIILIYFNDLLWDVIFYPVTICMSVYFALQRDYWLLISTILFIFLHIETNWHRFELSKIFLKAKKDYQLHTPVTRIVTVKKIKSDRLHNPCYENSINGIKKYVLYDTNYHTYYLSAKTKNTTLKSLNFLVNSDIEIKYFPQSRFILSIKLINIYDSYSKESTDYDGLKIKMQRCLGQYMNL